MDISIISLIIATLVFIQLLFLIYKVIRSEHGLSLLQHAIQNTTHEQKSLPQKIEQLQEKFNELQIKLLSQVHKDTTHAMTELNQQLNQNLQSNSELIDKQIKNLTSQTRQSLNEINQTVENNLTKNFEKTNATFNDIVKRLTLIDEAQKKISELSGQVVDLQQLLSDKRSRGAWGEVQLETIVQNLFSSEHYAMQHTLSNNKRVDCMLFLPAPTGHVPIDAKFPLETFRKIHNCAIDDVSNRKKLEQQFKIDIKKHIDDIANKYILPPETSEGVIMFIPAEAIFADIHSYHPDLIHYAQEKKVWLVSPSTLMAILTTAKAVLKDEATREQVHIIKEHLMSLAKDFGRFEKRMNNLTKHIAMANQDAIEVNTSAKKITAKFNKIEQAEFDTLEQLPETEE